MIDEATIAQRWVLSFSAGTRDLVDLIGGKGANLAELVRLGLPIPPGFVITTEACRAFLASDELPAELMAQVRAALSDLEDAVDRRFGDDADPLLVSVRSGAPVSMPGMMDTVLNVGLTPAGVPGFARRIGNEAAAEDCLRRLDAMYADTVGGPPPADAHAQLERSIVAVFHSWNSKRAALYRRYHGIPDTGTAVVVQSMVFGNTGPRSGTGVMFTRDPSTGDPVPFGDYLADAQGEDIVAGSHNADDLAGMERAVPEAHAELMRAAREVERHFRDLCEIEFTVEDGRLWLLQTRAGQRSARASVRVAVALAEQGAIAPSEAIARVSVDELDGLLHPRLDRDAIDEADALTTAIGASGGVATGRAVLDGERATELTARGEQVVLVRTETRPDDLEGILAASGLLTTRGGKTSHAAVVARGLGRPCVCGAEAIAIDLDSRSMTIGDATLREGEVISIDGDGGLVLRGAAPTLVPHPPEETARLLAWCDGQRSLKIAGLATDAANVRLAADGGADEIVIRIAAHVDDVDRLLPPALDAAGDLPVTVLSTASVEHDATGDHLRSLLEAVAGANVAVVVPAAAWELASAAADRLQTVVPVTAWARLGAPAPPSTPVAAVTWDETPTASSPAPAGARLAFPPDIGPQSISLTSALGAEALIVPADRVAVARLAAAQAAGR